MKKIAICAAVLGAMIGFSAIGTAEAMPLPSPTVSRSTDVTPARVIVRYGNWRGHRGYRQRRAGYRYYNGFWYPSIAFGPAVVIRPGRSAYWCGPRGNRHRCWR